MAKAYSNDLRERVIKNYESGISKKEILDIFIISLDTLNRWIRKYKETGSIEPYKRTKYRTKKFSDEALLEHVLKNPSATLEERAMFFSVKHQSVYTRMKALWITRKKRFFSMKKEMRRKEMSSPLR
ncbi:MAG: Transposase [Candidatus Electronema aureum]|uniref:Transposase n=1 Tax=Candidatus Electronema aureum TaxID=2005002 RepID=A0A521G146_9BACT|nr:MAG: Transposase [Candidatus Electronema aureum]